MIRSASPSSESAPSSMPPAKSRGPPLGRCRCTRAHTVAGKPKKSRTSKFRTGDLPEGQLTPFKAYSTLYDAGPSGFPGFPGRKVGPGEFGQWMTFTAFSEAPAAGAASSHEVALDQIGIWRQRNGLPRLTFSLSPEAPAARAVPRHRHRAALDQISIWRQRNGLPRLAGECLKKCGDLIALAIISVETLKEMAPRVIPPKDYRAMVRADAEKLREVALHGHGISEELLHTAAMLDNRAAAEQPRIIAMARDEAVRLADQLLKQFADPEGQYHADNKDPELTKGKPWHKLSLVLFGVAGADVWGAMGRCRRARDKARAPRP
jgi:hypothetical protein